MTAGWCHAGWMARFTSGTHRPASVSLRASSSPAATQVLPSLQTARPSWLWEQTSRWRRSKIVRSVRTTHYCISFEFFLWLSINYNEWKCNEFNIQPFSESSFQCNLLWNVCLQAENTENTTYRMSRDWATVAFRTLFTSKQYYISCGSQLGAQEPPRDGKIDLRGWKVFKHAFAIFGGHWGAVQQAANTTLTYYNLIKLLWLKC